MANRRINGRHLEKMLKNGLRNLVLHKEEVNRLNVFPVADGDTGTNMALTLRHGLSSAPSRNEVGAYLKPVSEGMLMGARGNSGVILSQLFKGMFTELSRCGWIGPGELRNALIRAYKTAYAAVVYPVEGTILTVAREGIEHIRAQIDRNTTIEAILSMYTAEMRKSLAFTPELLPALKEAGVIDSGAYGYILIFEGMLDQLYGKEHVVKKENEADAAPETAAASDTSLFNENSAFEEGYCTEFILQLMRSSEYDQHFDLKKFTSDLSLYGNSLVVAADGSRVKVHIHTKKPGRVIAAAQEYGEFVTFKLENMQLQHNEVLKTADENKKPLGIIAAVNGDGIAKTFSELGCDKIVVCGETMNASAEDFVKALSGINAKRVVILPNDKNVIMAAEQAARITGAENVTVLPSRSPAEGYYALAMDLPDSDDVERRVKLMNEGLQSTATLTESVAVRDFEHGDLKCRAGEEIVMLNGAPAASSTDWCDCIITALSQIPGIEDADSCVIFRGKDVSEEKEAILIQRISEVYPCLEATPIDGGQSVYHFIVGVSV